MVYKSIKILIISRFLFPEKEKVPILNITLTKFYPIDIVGESIAKDWKLETPS